MKFYKLLTVKYNWPIILYVNDVAWQADADVERYLA